MDSTQTLFDLPGFRLEELDFMTRDCYSPAGVEKQSLFETGLDGDWDTSDRFGSVYISGTHIPSPPVNQDSSLMQRFLFDSSRPAPLARPGPRIDAFGLGYDSINVHSSADTTNHGSPTPSWTDDQSVTDFCSSSRYARSDLTSDPRSPRNSLRQLFEAQKQRTWIVPGYGSAQADGNHLSPYQGQVVLGGGSVGSFVDPREMQYSPVPSSSDYGDCTHDTVHLGAVFGPDMSAPEPTPAHDLNMLATFAVAGSSAAADDAFLDGQVQPPSAKRQKRCNSQSSASFVLNEEHGTSEECIEHPGSNFATVSEWKDHLDMQHKRPFTCMFARYGCGSTFRSKNEWKRHINCSHLKLMLWRCDIDNCSSRSKKRHGGGGADNSNQPNEFNRKDLFTQHLRRMHCPAAIKADAAALDRWTDGLAATHERCCFVNRLPPGRGVCGYCGTAFEGEGSWDDCLEHVGKHFERLDRVHTHWVDDVGLREYMIGEGLLQSKGHGEWTTVLKSKKRKSRSRRCDDDLEEVSDD